MEAHIILKPDLFSIQNMLDVKSGELGKKLQSLIISCNKHIVNCQVENANPTNAVHDRNAVAYQSWGKVRAMI
jgi:hypothetical protein